MMTKNCKKSAFLTIGSAPPGSFMKIRQFQKKDAEAIAKMINNARWKEGIFIEPQNKVTEEGMMKYIQGKKGSKYRMLVAEEGRRIVGYIDFETGRIDGIYVLPECRKKKIGRALMRKAMSALGESEDIELKVFASNRKAVKFFENFGFVATGDRRKGNRKILAMKKEP